MLNHELLLISKILETKDFATVERLKVTDDSFLTSECRAAFKYLKKFYHNSTTFGHLPSPELFRQTFSGFPIYEDIPDSVEVLCHEIKTRQLRKDLEETAERILLYANNNDPFGGFNFLRERGITLTSDYEVNEDLPLAESADILEEEYRLAEENKGILGIPWPWARLNDVTMGIQKGHLIYVRAKAKTGKTTEAVAALIHAYKYFNARILVYSMEMVNSQINKLAACYYAGIDYELCCKGQLNPADKHKYFETLRMFKESEAASGVRGRAWLTTSGEGTTGISALKAKIIEFDPDIVLIDGVYLLYDEKSRKSDSDWKTIMNISRSLKSMQKELKVKKPVRDFAIIGIVQSDDDDGYALAKYMKQDCDVSILFQAGVDEGTRQRYLKWTVDAIRVGKPGEGYLNFYPGLDYSERDPPQISADAHQQGTPRRTQRGPAIIPNVPVFGFPQNFGIPRMG